MSAPQQPNVFTNEETDCRLNISVIFTSVRSTIAALKKAAMLANGLAARIMLVVPRVVPYPLSLDTPPVLPDFNEQRFQAISAQSPVETSVHLIYCRDTFQGLRKALSLRSVVLIGSTRRWWPFTPERRLIRALRRAGYNVIYTEKE